MDEAIKLPSMYVLDKILEWFVIDSKQSRSREQVGEGVQAYIKSKLIISEYNEEKLNIIFETLIEYIPIALIHLKNEGYIDLNEYFPQYECSITFKGKLFIEQGGYLNDFYIKNISIRRAAVEERQSAIMNLLTKILAIGIIAPSVANIMDIVKGLRRGETLDILLFFFVLAVAIAGVWLWLFRSIQQLKKDLIK